MKVRVLWIMLTIPSPCPGEQQLHAFFESRMFERAHLEARLEESKVLHVPLPEAPAKLKRLGEGIVAHADW